MCEIDNGGGAGGALRREDGNAAARRVAAWLSLAASPIFAIMALLTGALGGGPMAAMCAGAMDASPLNGMVAMYVLMSAFHAAPWLTLVSNRRGIDRRS